jgi:TAG lipase / steryl ester hydrolase / phospholipase A2 / LPA acyltransferase
MKRYYPLHNQNLWTADSLRRPATSLRQLASSTRANLHWLVSSIASWLRPPPANSQAVYRPLLQQSATKAHKDEFALDVVSSLCRWLAISPPLPQATRDALSSLLVDSRESAPETVPADALFAEISATSSQVANVGQCGQEWTRGNAEYPETYENVNPSTDEDRTSSLASRLFASLLLLLMWPTRIAFGYWRRLSEYRSFALQRAALLHTLETALTYSDWRAAALALDTLEGSASWKLSLDMSDPILAVCSLDVVAGRLSELRDLYVSGDIKNLAFALRQGLERNAGGICHPDLHKYSRVGTKQVVEDYVNVVAFLLLHVAFTTPTRCDLSGDENSSRNLSKGAKLRLFNEARHAYGRTALLLSGGAAMGLNHLGVVKTLLDHDLLPRVVSGTSAGSIVASIVGIFDDVDLKSILASEELVNPISGQPFSFRYFDESLALFRSLQRLMRKGAFQDIRMLQDCLRKNFGDMTFSEAYGRTRRILNITVCPVRNSLGPPMLLNYLTSPNVLIWSAASASCALPMVFAPVELVAKDSAGRLVAYQDGRRWIDGSITSDVPIARIGELFNVNHFIVSQTNPHVIPKSLPLFQTRIALLLKSEFQFRYWQALQLRLVPRIVSSIFPHMLQPYEGDVTIMPEVNLRDLMRLFKNPTKADVRDYLIRGERQAFVELDRLRLHCLIERTLDGCIEAAAQVKGKDHASSRKATLSLKERNLEIGRQSFDRVPSWLWAESSSRRRAANEASATDSAPSDVNFTSEDDDVDFRNANCE